VGPTAEGLIPPPSVERLKGIGKWMATGGEAIYGTQASPLAATPWGRATRKTLPGGNTRVFLHVFQWPQDGKLLVQGLTNKPLRAYLLAGGMELEVQGQSQGLSIALPATMPDKIATVVAVDIEGAPPAVKSGAQPAGKARAPGKRGKRKA